MLGPCVFPVIAGGPVGGPAGGGALASAPGGGAVRIMRSWLIACAAIGTSDGIEVANSLYPCSIIWAACIAGGMPPPRADGIPIGSASPASSGSGWESSISSGNGGKEVGIELCH